MQRENLRASIVLRTVLDMEVTPNSGSELRLTWMPFLGMLAGIKTLSLENHGNCFTLIASTHHVTR